MLPVTSNRIVLRECKPEDWVFVYRCFTDTEYTKYSDYAPQDVGSAKKLIDDAINKAAETERVFFQLIVEDRGTNETLGFARISIDDLPTKQGSIGYGVSSALWGKGLGTEVVTLLLSFGFGALCLQKISAMCDSRNIGSWRVLEKAGMVKEATLESAAVIDGISIDVLVYGLSREAWLSRSKL